MPFGLSIEFQQTGRFSQELEKECVRRLEMSAQMLRTRVLTNLSGVRTGRLARVPGTNRKYRVSVPGEYPAVRTGALHSSVRLIHPSVWQYAIGTNLKYGQILEQGKRPWLRRSAEEVMPDILKVWRIPWKFDWGSLK